MNTKTKNPTEAPTRLRKHQARIFMRATLLLWLAIAGFVPNLRADDRTRWVAEGQAAVESWLRSGPDESLKDEFGDFVSLEGPGYVEPVWNIQGYEYLTLNRTAHFTRGTIPMTIYVTEGAATAPGLTNVGPPRMERRNPGATDITIYVSHPELGPGKAHSLTDVMEAALKAKKQIEQAWQTDAKKVQFDQAVQRWGDEGLTAVDTWLRSGTNKINALCGDFVCFQAEDSPEFRLDTGSDFGRGNKPSMRFTVRALFSRGYIPLTIIITDGRVAAPGLTNVGTPVIDGPVGSFNGARILVAHPEICVPDDFQPQDPLKFLAADGEAKLARSYKLTTLRKQHAFAWMDAKGPANESDTLPAEQLAELRSHPCTLELRADHTLAISNYPVLDDAQRFVTVLGNWSLRAQRDLNHVQFKLSVSVSGEVKPRSATCDLVYPDNSNPNQGFSPGLNLLCRDESGNQLELWFKAIKPIPPSYMRSNPHFVTRSLTNNPPNWNMRVNGNPEIELQETIDYQRNQNIPNNINLATFLIRLADLLQQRGKLYEAETNVLQGLQILRESRGNKYAGVGEGLIVQARILRDQVDLADAEKSVREALTIFDTHYYKYQDIRYLLNQILILEGKPIDTNTAPTSALAPAPAALPTIAEQMDEAATKGDLETVSNLFAAHPELIDARNAWGSTPLTDASYNGRDAVVAWPLAHGADVNTQNNMLWTPLIHAARRGHVGVVRLLLAHHADVILRTNLGYTVLDIARQYHWPEVEALLASQNVQTNDIHHELTPPR